MGTTFGSLHILDVPAEAVSALMPHALVGRWSPRFVTALDRGLLPGPPVERQGQTLSKALDALVLAAWMFDDDAAGLVLFQNGRRTAALSCGPDGRQGLGWLPLLISALGLPGGDEARLKALWRHGDPWAVLEYTGALIGAPLAALADAPPEGAVCRDEAAVDQWIARFVPPPPPKVRNRTRAVLTGESQPGDGGLLGPAEEEPRRLYVVPGHGAHRFGGRTYRLLAQPDPLRVLLQRLDAQGAPDGGYLSELNAWVLADMGQGLLLLEPGLRQVPRREGHYHLVRLDGDMRAVGGADLPGAGIEAALAPGGDFLFCTGFRTGMWVLDPVTLAVLAGREDPTAVGMPCVDGAGRLWLLCGPGTVAGFGRDLAPVSRHRLKGRVLAGGLSIGGDGVLTARTWSEADQTLRTYRIS